MKHYHLFDNYYYLPDYKCFVSTSSLIECIKLPSEFTSSFTDIQPKKLAELLYDKGLVSDKTIAFFQIQFSDYKGKFVGGTYEVNTGMTPTDIMEVLSQTDSEEE